jgi:hypothetical protein
MSKPVCIFWDNSNVFIGAQVASQKIDAQLGSRGLRLQFEALFNLAKAGRPIAKAVCVGSVPPELDGVWSKLRATGIQIELFERGEESGKEQGVDQCLQVQMLRAMVDVSPPGICVLLTGDGAGYDSGVGFHADLERMKKMGWGIEVLSWEACCNKKLMNWAKTAGVFIRLEDYYTSLTFLKGLRNAAPLSFKGRLEAK